MKDFARFNARNRCRRVVFCLDMIPLRQTNMELNRLGPCSIHHNHSRFRYQGGQIFAGTFDGQPVALKESYDVLMNDQVWQEWGTD